MGTVTSLFVRKMVAAIGPAVNATELLSSVGIDADAPVDPKLRISDGAYYALLERIAELTDVTSLPLTTGASMRCDDYGALGLAFKAATTLHGSFARVARFAKLWTSVVEYELVPGQDTTWFHLHRTGNRRLGLRLSNEATLASAVTIAREVSAARFTPLEVHIQHPAPMRHQPHAAFFGCPVHFDSDWDALLISNQMLAEKNILGDQGITQFLLSHLEKELSELSSEASLRDQLRDAIARSLSDGQPKMEDIGARLGMSVRSLHRRLSEESISFQTLTDETRRELAEGLLRDDAYSLSEVAFLTGFSEQSSFTRAFKRWCGDTPAAFRKRKSA